MNLVVSPEFPYGDCAMRSAKSNSHELIYWRQRLSSPARVAKLADARDLKSRVSKETYRFNSGPGHHIGTFFHLTCRA